MEDDRILKTDKGYLTDDFLGSNDKNKWFTDDIDSNNLMLFDSELCYNGLHNLKKIAGITEYELIERCS